RGPRNRSLAGPDHGLEVLAGQGVGAAVRARSSFHGLLFVNGQRASDRPEPFATFTDDRQTVHKDIQRTVFGIQRWNWEGASLGRSIRFANLPTFTLASNDKFIIGTIREKL